MPVCVCVRVCVCASGLNLRGCIHSSPGGRRGEDRRGGGGLNASTSRQSRGRRKRRRRARGGCGTKEGGVEGWGVEAGFGHLSDR